MSTNYYIFFIIMIKKGLFSKCLQKLLINKRFYNWIIKKYLLKPEIHFNFLIPD